MKKALLMKKILTRTDCVSQGQRERERERALAGRSCTGCSPVSTVCLKHFFHCMGLLKQTSTVISFDKMALFLLDFRFELLYFG